jgi:hypothetical protein
VIVLVEARDISCLSLRQSADYIALLGMAQIRSDAKPGGAPTILRLFETDSGPPPDGLSNWNQAFLKALYSSHADDSMQISEIKDRLDQALIH